MGSWLSNLSTGKAYRSLVRMFLVVGVLCLLADWRRTGIACLIIGSIGGGIAAYQQYLGKLIKR